MSCAVSCELVSFASWTGWRLYPVMNGATDWIPCPDAVGKTVLNPVKLFVVLTQADPHPNFFSWTSSRALLCKLSALPVFLSSQTPLGCTVCRSYLQPSWSDGARRHYSVWSCSSALCLDVGKLGSQAGKTLGFRILIRLICTPLNFLVRVCPQLGFTDEWDCCLGLLFRYWRYELCLPRPTHQLLQNPFPFSTSIGCLPTDSPATSVVWDQSWDSHKVSPFLGDIACLPGFSFLIGGIRVSGETSLHVTALD